MSVKIDGVNRFRGFEPVSYAGDKVILPYAATEDSACYDFSILEPIVIKPGEFVQVWTGVKAYMQTGEVLMLYPRSSFGTKYQVMLINTVGIIDKDYYNNKDNEGNIGVGLYNFGNKIAEIPAGRICQGMFTYYLRSDNGNSTEKRVGGYGSTGR